MARTSKQWELDTLENSHHPADILLAIRESWTAISKRINWEAYSGKAVQSPYRICLHGLNTGRTGKYWLIFTGLMMHQ